MSKVIIVQEIRQASLYSYGIDVSSLISSPKVILNGKITSDPVSVVLSQYHYTHKIQSCKQSMIITTKDIYITTLTYTLIQN